MPIDTWADGYGRWHARVPQGPDSAEVARTAIVEQLAQRERNLAPDSIQVETDPIAEPQPGTAVYREVTD